MCTGVHAWVLHVHVSVSVCVFMSVNQYSSPGVKVIIQLLNSDADSVYCIQVLPLDIMSAEI